MNKKILVATLALGFVALMSASGFAQCTTPVFQFNGVGSSAQFNSMTYAALYLANGGSLPAPGAYNLWTSSKATLQDLRFSPAATDAGVKMSIVWDNGAPSCNVWVVSNVDSGVGVKDFFAYQKKTENGVTNAVVSAVDYASLGAENGSLIPGFPDNNGSSLPAQIVTFLTTQAGPTASHGAGSLPVPMCGQLLTTAGGTNHYCFFNAALSDIRPEDILYATTRALSAYSTTNGLAGLGYAQIGNGAGAGGCGALSAEEGCEIFDALGQTSHFNVLNFALTGNDPVGAAAVPLYSTLNVGAAPVVVFVSNADTRTGGFGSKSGGNYVFTNINKTVLSKIEEGTLHCSTDIFPGYGTVGHPIQVFQREPLSGTYNTFEFTGVRTLSGSAATTVGQNKVTSTTWISDDSSGQELGNNPATNYNDGTAGCPGNANAAPDGSEVCGDPKLLFTPSSYAGVSASGSGCGKGVIARAIGTGELVKAVAGAFTLPSAWFPSTNDAFGYAFWSYQNFAPVVKSSNCTSNASGNSICTSSAAHYLTVDGVDPFTPNPGAASLTTGVTAYELPQCTAVVTNNNAAFPCAQIPFTHIQDGGYPLFTILRAVTFENIVQNSNIGGCTTPPCPTQQTPAGVTDMVAATEINATNNSYNLSDFQPFFQNLTVVTPASGCPTYNATTNPNPVCYKGDLLLGVFRSHYVQARINPNNGHAACANNFTGVILNGNTYNSTTKKTSDTCLVDLGGDVGGAIMSVQADVDFNLDFGSLFAADGSNYEIYGLRH